MLKRSLLAATALVIVLAVLTASPATAVGSGPRLAGSARSDIGPSAVGSPWARSALATVDWKWLRGGWEIRFSQRETSHIAVSAGACSSLLSHFRHPVVRVLAVGCGLLTWYASVLVIRGRCLKAFVTLQLFRPFTLSSRAC